MYATYSLSINQSSGSVTKVLELLNRDIATIGDRIRHATLAKKPHEELVAKHNLLHCISIYARLFMLHLFLADTKC